VLRLDTGFKSAALGGEMHALVVLPAGYATSHKRYPVIYFLHGLPARSSTYLHNEWLAERGAAAGQFILVEPQGARDSDTDPEYIDWGGQRDWATYLTKELPAYVDSRFRTIRSRDGRAIIGLSAGGYGATMLGLNNLDEFSVIESWSGYFHATSPSGRAAIAAPPRTNVHTLISTLASSDRSKHTFLAFYVGRSDPIFVPENEQFASELTAAGIPHTFDVYPGGHDEKLWATHAVAWLRLALSHLATPS
jgi:enterochelin esterase-like enzyme